MRPVQIVMILASATLMACGSGTSTNTPTTLAAGQSVTLASGESIEVPSGTTVQSNGSTVTLNGDHNTVHTAAGAVVSAPASATGAADNTVIAN